MDIRLQMLKSIGLYVGRAAVSAGIGALVVTQGAKLAHTVTNEVRMYRAYRAEHTKPKTTRNAK